MSQWIAVRSHKLQDSGPKDKFQIQTQNPNIQVLSGCDTWQWKRMLNKSYSLRERIFRRLNCKFYVSMKTMDTQKPIQLKGASKMFLK